MTKVIVRCLSLDWNHWMSVHAMNFYFYLWLLKILWPENTSSHISRHLEFIKEQGHRVNWVSGSLDSRVSGSQNVTQFHVCHARLHIPPAKQSCDGSRTSWKRCVNSSWATNLCLYSYPSTLTTWHCPHSPAAAAAVDRYLLLAGTTAANLQ